MTRQASVKVGSAWKQVKAISVKVGGAWKQVRSGYVKISGTWREFFSAEPDIILPSASTLSQEAVFAVAAYAGVQFTNDGQLKYVRGQSLSWLNHLTGWMDPKEAESAALFEVRATRTAGTTHAGGMTSGTWYGMDTTRSCYMQQLTVGSNESTFTFDIRRASDQEVLYTVTDVVFTVIRTS